jgi:hypothetical protein
VGLIQIIVQDTCDGGFKMLKHIYELFMSFSSIEKR